MVKQNGLKKITFYLQIQASDSDSSESNNTINTIEDFRYRTKKIITSVNVNYENLIPEEKFAAHLMKKVTRQILENLKTEILNGIHNLEEISNTTNFNVCTENIDFGSVMEMYENCIESKTNGSRQEVAHNLTETLIFSDEKIAKILKDSKECNSTGTESNCNKELAERMQAAYEEILSEVNEANGFILNTYHNVVKEMPACATKSIYHVINLGNIFKCLIMLVQNTP